MVMNLNFPSTSSRRNWYLDNLLIASHDCIHPYPAFAGAMRPNPFLKGFISKNFQSTNVTVVVGYTMETEYLANSKVLGSGKYRLFVRWGSLIGGSDQNRSTLSNPERGGLKMRLRQASGNA